jgi:hypothetical protein
MGIADKQIRVSETVKRTIERHRRADESYNDVLERLLSEADTGDFDDGFGRWDDDDADRIRDARQQAKRQRKQRMRDRATDTR